MPKRCRYVLPKPGKLTSTHLKDKRHIVLLPLITFGRQICNSASRCYMRSSPGTPQYGFQPKKGTREALHVARQYLHMRRRSGVDTYVLSVDIIKAFDKVDHRLLMAILTKLGVPESLTGCIRRLFDNRKLMFSYNGKDAPEPIQIHSGVGQGGPLRPTLYKFFKLAVTTAMHKRG